MAELSETEPGSLMQRLFRIHSLFRSYPEMHETSSLEKVPMLFPGTYTLNAWDTIIAISRAHGLDSFAEAPRRKEDAVEAPIALTPETFAKMASWSWPPPAKSNGDPNVRTALEQFHSLRLSLLNCFDHLRGKADLLERSGFALDEVYDFVFGGVIVTTVEGGPISFLAAMAPDGSGKCRCFIIDAEIGFQS